MRREVIVSLEPGRDVRVKEATVGDMRRLIGILPDDTAPTEDWPGLFRKKIPEIVALISDAITLPNGEQLDGLPVSELEAILKGWWGLHRGFFALALGAMGMEIAEKGQGQP
jgi:hypothetical protein